MVKKQKKLNAMRILEKHRVPYTVYEFPSDQHYSAIAVAEFIGLPAEQVYKTLVVQHTNGTPLLAVIPGPSTLNLKALAAAVGEKKLSMASHVDAEQLTGLQVGGISPLALVAKHWQVVLDESATHHEHIAISAGKRGINLGVAVTDLETILTPMMAAVSTD